MDGRYKVFSVKVEVYLDPEGERHVDYTMKGEAAVYEVIGALESIKMKLWDESREPQWP